MGVEYCSNILILEHHLDSFGHVNNATYMELYEQARWDTITAGGFGLKEIKELEQGPVILDAHIRYKKELRNREAIKIITSIEVDDHPLVGKVFQKMEKEDGTIASTAEFKMGLMDLKKRKLIKPTEKWLSAIGVKS